MARNGVILTSCHALVNHLEWLHQPHLNNSEHTKTAGVFVSVRGANRDGGLIGRALVDAAIKELPSTLRASSLRSTRRRALGRIGVSFQLSNLSD